MARRRHPVVDYLEYLALRLTAMVLLMFDIRTNYRTARWMGELIWRLDRRHRHIACEHLRRSFPDWDEARILRTARKSMHNLVFLAVEVLMTPRLITAKTWRRHVRMRDIADSLRYVMAGRSGVIMLTGHFGNFEVVGYAMATLGFPTVSVARPLDNRLIWDHMVNQMERTGQRFLYKRGAMGSAGEVLRNGGALSFVADQDAGRKGLFVDFFGRPASTYKSIGLLAVRHRAPVLIGYGQRVSERFQFEIGVERAIYPDEWQGRPNPVEWITREYTRALETSIRRAPEQYLWVHRRWKHRPDGTKAPGHGVA